MTFEIGLALGILLTAIVLFVSERVRVDLVALMVLVTLALTGLITPQQAISGFSNPAVVTVWAVFILSGGLSRTGVAGILGRQVLRLAGHSEARLVVVIMLTAALLSGFMNNVGVAALLLPVVMDIARRTGRAPSKLLIPLAFSSLLGGLMTQIGTPPNILVSAALEGHGLEPFELFDFTPVGLAVVLAGITYMTLIGRRLLPDRDSGQPSAPGEVDLDRVYGLRDGLFVLEVPEDSFLTGKSLAECRVGSALGLNVMGIARGERVELAPDPAIVFEPGDRIIVEGQRDDMGALGAREYLRLESTEVKPADLVSPEVDFAEVALSPRSRLAGKTLREIDFRHRFHEYRRAGVPVLLGTDSAASNEALDMRRELRLAAESLDLEPRELFRMATSGAAHRLPWPSVSGRIEIDRAADLVALTFSKRPLSGADSDDELFGRFVRDDAEVHGVWVGGVPALD